MTALSTLPALQDWGQWLRLAEHRARVGLDDGATGVLVNYPTPPPRRGGAKAKILLDDPPVYARIDPARIVALIDFRTDVECHPN